VCGGGIRVRRATLTTFFVIHFLSPFILIVVGGVHIILLHSHGRSSLLFIVDDRCKIIFHPYYSLKDLYNLIIFRLFFIFALLYPWVLGDREIFIEANRIISPIRIVPE
jgi:ubiquinol-cytochrome c reductase cytochrome b subunit